MAFQFSIPGTTEPWRFAGGINSSYTYGLDDGTNPIVIATGLSQGMTVGINYASGMVVASDSRSYYDPNGDTTTVANGNPGSTSTFFPSKYMSGDWFRPVYLIALVGAFTTNTGQVIQPVFVGRNPQTTTYFTDSFPGTSLNSQWTQQQDGVGGTLSVSGGTLNCTPAFNTNDYIGVRSTIQYDWRNQQAACQITNVPSSSATYGIGDTNFIWSNNTTFTTYHGFTIRRDGTGLHLFCYYNSGSVFSTTYDATNHAYLRLQISGTSLYFQVSADGTTYSTLFTQTGITAANFSALYMYMRSGINSGGTASPTINFGNFTTSISTSQTNTSPITFVTPAGATQFQLGLNDDHFADNLGSYIVNAYVTGSAQTSVSMPTQLTRSFAPSVFNPPTPLYNVQDVRFTQAKIALGGSGSGGNTSGVGQIFPVGNN